MLALLSVLGLSILMLWPDLFRGWAPQDEGGLAQVAERVLNGQMPHRDFDDPWTGGWSYFQAAVFRLFGTRMSLVRLPIFLAWLTGLAVAYRLMRRAASPVLSGCVAIACGMWSLYAWRFPLLSWFYFPSALITCWCAIRYVESKQRAWLFAAGFVVGALLLVKVTAMFLLAGLLLWILTVASESGETATAGSRRFVIVVAGIHLTYLGGVALVVRGLPGEMQGAATAHFWLPQFLLAIWSVRHASRCNVGIGAGRRTLLRLVWPLVAGVVLALLPYVAIFALEHELPALVSGVFVKPGVRLSGFALSPPGRVGTALALLAPMLLIAGCRFARQEQTRRELVLAVLCGAGLGAFSFTGAAAASAMALSIRSMPIALPLAALWWKDLTTTTESSRALVVLLVFVAVTSQLAQVPYSAFAYFLYVAPLSILATAALMSARMRTAPVVAFWTAMLIVSGVRPDSGSAQTLHTLPLHRGGLQVSLLDSVRYGRMATFVASQPPGPIVVLGDHPELPFLLERPNGSRVIYDVIADPALYSPRSLLRALDSAGVRTIIIAHRGGTRGTLDAPRISALRSAYPCGTAIGRFELRSRDLGSAGQPANPQRCSRQVIESP
ncbi:MAG: glycosyltransferase family 39 protein [Gemmatimonadetes bacterium]|nr:glycosyltransferase family 39 protein [Gemmatimonadota bacterium]